MRKVFLEIGALFEDHWTGIPNVVAALAKRALQDTSLNWSFVFDTIEIPHNVVARFLSRHSGRGGLEIVARLAWEGKFVSHAVAEESIGIYTNIKPMRRFFHKEAMIIYDLSPILSPQYHNSDNISHFANRIREDIESSDHLFCISKAAMTDVHAYFGKDLSEMSIIELGVDFDYSHISPVSLPLHGFSSEPYVVIVGTLEPRKNGRIMLDYLIANPDFTERFRTVFIGRDGWLDERNLLLDRLADAGVNEDRVVFAGFLSEADKVALILNSSFCIYPSFFEGYGLPVLEAAALGKTTVCSNSSSIPEVHPGSAIFFDPANIDEFGAALAKAEIRAAQTQSHKQSLHDIIARAHPFSWDRCYPGVAHWVRQNVEE